MKTCASCGESNCADEFQFCNRCGAKLLDGAFNSNESQHFVDESKANHLQPNQHFNQHIPNGVIGVRSGTIMFQLIFNIIINVPSFALTIWGFMHDPVLGVVFLMFDIWAIPFIIYFSYMLKKMPKICIEFVEGEFVIHTSRKETLRLKPQEIVNISAKGGNWLLNGWLHMADGTVCLQTNTQLITMRFIKQSIATQQQLNQILWALTQGGNLSA